MNKSCGEEVSVVAQKLLKPDVSPVRWSWARGKPALHSAHGQVHRHLNSRMPAPGPPHSFPAPAHTPLQGSLCFRSTNGLQEGWFLPVVIAPGAPLNTQGRGPIPSRDQGTPWEQHRWALPINATFHGPNAPRGAVRARARRRWLPLQPHGPLCGTLGVGCAASLTVCHSFSHLSPVLD